MRTPEYDPRYAEPVRQATAFSPFVVSESLADEVKALSETEKRRRECAEFCGPKPITCVNCGGCMIHSESCQGKAKEFRALVEKTREIMDKIDEKDRKARATLYYYGQIIADNSSTLAKVEFLDMVRYMNEALEDLK